MQTPMMLAVTVCATALMLGIGCRAPVKVTGGGKALGVVFLDPESPEMQVFSDVLATAAGQAILTEPEYNQERVIGYRGRGNLQFVEPLTGMCFHAELTFGGADPSTRLFIGPIRPDDYEPDRTAYGTGTIRFCTSSDGIFDDGMAHVWIYDRNANGPDKDDCIVVDLFDAGDNHFYLFGGYLKSGNYKVRTLGTE